MQRILLVLSLFVSLSIFSGAALANVVGIWATKEEKSRVEISECGKKLCGEIIWLKEPLNDKKEPKTDTNNPDEKLRSRKIIGLKLLSGFVPSSEKNKWEDGEIYNPEDGKTYSCTMTLLPDGRLEVRGYVGISLFGKSQIWTKVE